MRRNSLSALITLAVLATATAADKQTDTDRGFDTTNPILFVTQLPIPADFATIGSTFANHDGRPQRTGRGGDLYLRFPDGTLRNLTAEAGLGMPDGFQGADSIAVREPCVHWSGQKALVSIVIGAPTERYRHADFFWQIYEVTGLEPGDTAVITRVPGQPTDANNVSPIYSSDPASDERIIFTSDRPRSGAAHLYPQLDEYESTPTNTGLWSLDPATGALFLLAHAPSGAFSPAIDSSGRVVFTKWDHLQRDQQADAEAMYGGDVTFNYTDESSGSTDAGHRDEYFPEPRGSWIAFIRDNPDYEGPLRGYEPHLEGHTIEIFQPWQLNQDGTGEETLIHVGRHELQTYFNRSFNDDPSLREFIAGGHGSANRLRNVFHLAEDPIAAGRFWATDAPTFGSHSCGQVISFCAGPDVNPDDIEVTYVTHRDTASPGPSGENHSGLYRTPLPLANGLVVVTHTDETRRDENEGSRQFPISRYDLRLKVLDTSGDYAVAGAALTSGIVRTIEYWDPDELIHYEGAMWELDAVEVVARPAPTSPTNALDAPELEAFALERISVDAVRTFLEETGQALVVSRDLTTRDRADRQQPFNLEVEDTDTRTLGDDGRIYPVRYLQFFQGDQIRGMRNRAGRRILGLPMHADLDNPPSDGPAGSVQLGDDGSMAALVPTRRAMTWQLTDTDGAAVVRERFWLTFQPGEIRTCTSCHGVNRLDQSFAEPPRNTPQALRDLLAYLADEGLVERGAIPGDVDGDGFVDFDDLVALLSAWGGSDPDADLDGNGIVDFGDLVILLANWT